MPIKQRIKNFEIMRTVAMFFIVIWHSCVHGTKMGGDFNLYTTSGIFNCFSTMWICSLTGVAVNLYVMITGYFMIDKVEFRIRRFERTWFHTMLYALGFSLAAFIMSPDLTHIKIITELFYVNTGYWFVNKYLGLILIAPFLARLASLLSRRDYKLLLLALGVMSISFTDSYNPAMGEVNHGYSLQWFVFLFFIAGYVKKHEPFKKSNKVTPLFLLFWVINFAFVLFERYLAGTLNHPITNIPYNGIIFFESFFLFLVFRDYQFRSKIWQPLAALAPFTFGIYLIHENPFISNIIWKGAYSPSHLFNSWYLIPYIIVLSLVLFFACAFIDAIRYYIVNYLRLGNILTIFNKFMYKKLISCITAFNVSVPINNKQ